MLCYVMLTEKTEWEQIVPVVCGYNNRKNYEQAGIVILVFFIKQPHASTRTITFAFTIEDLRFLQ